MWPAPDALARGHFVRHRVDGLRALLGCGATRVDRTREFAAGAGARLLTLGRVEPGEVPYRMNAADAVLVSSEQEGFRVPVREAPACDVPAPATPAGSHPIARDGVPGALCAPYDRDASQAALAPHVQAAEPRVAGCARAALWPARCMAERALAAWTELTDPALYSRAEAPMGAVRT